MLSDIPGDLVVAADTDVFVIYLGWLRRILVKVGREVEFLLTLEPVGSS